MSMTRSHYETDRISTPLSASPSQNRRVLIVDDHPIFREGVQAILECEDGIEVVAQSADARDGLKQVRELLPDLVIVDITLPGCDGIEFIKMVSAEFPSIKLLTVSSHDEATYGPRALKAGAIGYLMKDAISDRLGDAIKLAARGHLVLSPSLNDRLVMQAINGQITNSNYGAVDSLSDRELEVFRLLGRGHSTSNIAKQLGLSIKTVESHRANIRDKLGCTDSAQMVAMAIDYVQQERF